MLDDARKLQPGMKIIRSENNKLHCQIGVTYTIKKILNREWIRLEEIEGLWRIDYFELPEGIHKSTGFGKFIKRVECSK